MDWILEIVKNIVELGLIYSLVVLGVHLSSNIIKFDDLSTEGSFAVGGALTALLLFCGIHNVLILPLALIAGACVGMVTGLLHTKLGINNLMSGIVVTAALFSINLKLAGPNVSLTQFTMLPDLMESLTHDYAAIICFGSIVLCAYGLIHWLLSTEAGLVLKSVGCNPQMLVNLGKSVHTYKIMGLMLSNALSALGGSLFVQHMKFFSITGSVGTLVIALAGLIIGNAVVGSSLWGLIIGSMLYQAVISATIEMQLDPAWNKLIASLVIVILIALRHKKHHVLVLR